MRFLGDGRHARRYQCKPVDESAVNADRASYAPDLSSSYKYVFLLVESSASAPHASCQCSSCTFHDLPLFQSRPERHLVPALSILATFIGILFYSSLSYGLCLTGSD